MKKILFSIFIISFSPSLIGQNLEEALNLVNEFSNFKSLSEFKEAHPKIAAYVSKTPHYEVNKEKESLIKTDVGEIAYISYENLDKQFVHKVLDRYVGPIHKVKYIYLDGTKLKMEEIDSLRNLIITEYSNGISFDDLHLKYNMDGGTTSELNWFCEDTMVKEFEDAVLEHKKGDIFKVDVPQNKWYYVTLKHKETKNVLITKSFWVKYWLY